MSILFNVALPPEGATEEFLELCGDALVNCDPPLSKMSRAHIALIRTERLQDLTGTDHFEANCFFDLLDKLPPIEGIRSASLISLLVETDFSIDAIKQSFAKLRAKPDEVRPQKDEWGFAQLPSSILDTGEKVNLSCDLERAERDGMQRVVDIYLQLIKIEDPAVRILLAQDCEKIVKLRLLFDIY